MTSLQKNSNRVRRFLTPLLALSVALPAFAQQVADPTVKTAAEQNPVPVERKPGATGGEESVLELSPFVVTTDKDQGYFAQNTLAGSRMRMNLADLGASISVVTKQQMEDTASIDLNDVLRYELNTEGSSTYTPMTQSMRNDGVLDVNAGGTQGSSVSSFTNAGANRIRGLGAPSRAINYFPSIGQVPVDSYNVQSLEISRGPNSMIFGLGSPAGIVNQSTAQAVLNRDTYKVTARTDQYGSYRGTFSFNKSLIDDKLAIFGALAYDNRQFNRKPSYDKTRRQYIAATFKPFKKTTLRADFENYDNRNRRPNTITPRDYITQWDLAGRPVWNALTRQVILGNGQVASVNVRNSTSVHAQSVRDYIRNQPDYNPTLRGTSATAFNGTDANFTFYNGLSIFGETALTGSAGFDPASGIPSRNILYVPGINFNQARTVQQIADGQLYSWFQPTYGHNYRSGWGTATNPTAAAPFIRSEGEILANSTWADVYNRAWTRSEAWTAIGNGLQTYRYPGVSDQSIYDWEEVNINQMNFGHDKNNDFHVELDQEILPNLHFNAGWFRQDFESRTNYTVAQLNATALFIDTNMYLPDGTPNPFVGKPFVEDQDPDQYINKALDDHYRAMLAWTPDFTRNQGWTRWLGRHQILGMWSRDDSMKTAIRRRFSFIDSNTFDGKVRYLPNQNNNADGTPAGWNLQGSYRRQFYLASPSDPDGVVTRSSGEWNHLTYTGNIRTYDYPASTFKDVNVTTAYHTFDGSGRNQQRDDSKSWAASSFLWNDRLIVTAGARKDEFMARTTNTGLPAVTDEDGTVLAPAITNPQKWVNGVYQTDLLFNRWNRWQTIEGTTRTLGGVLRPFQKWQGIDRRADSGNLFWQFVQNFGLSYNKSDNFNPPGGAFGDFFGNPLPKPSGEGKDFGFQFSVLDNKLFARVTWFEASNANEQFGATATLSRLSGHIDTTAFRNWSRTIAMINRGHDPRLTGFGENLSVAEEQAIQDAAEVIWQQPYDYYSTLPFSTSNATRSADAKGYEIEVNFNPNRNWTVRATFGRQDTKYADVMREYDAWWAVREPVWMAAKASQFLLPQYASMVTYTTAGGRPVDLTNFWTSYGFDSNIVQGSANGWTNVQNYYEAVLAPQVTLSRDLEGQSAPGQRKYSGAILTSYTFREGKLKGFAVGGSQRWASKATIGYYGKASGANGTNLDVSDVTRPVWDDGNFYTGLWASYSRRILRDKVGMKIQLNVDNVFEGGGLRAVGVNFDGSPYAFRIIDPRQFIVTTSFEF
jgi:outer membrane receptor protein involved in Fe transport